MRNRPTQPLKRQPEAEKRHGRVDCRGLHALALLNHSQGIKGHRTGIDALRRDAQKACG
jgi:hypothetical protein